MVWTMVWVQQQWIRRVKITLYFNILMCQYEINCLRQMEYAVLIISYAWKKNWCWHLCCKIVVMGPSLQFIFVKFILYILQQLNNPCTVNRQNSQKYWDSWPSNCWAHTAHHMHINYNAARTSIAKYINILVSTQLSFLLFYCMNKYFCFYFYHFCPYLSTSQWG